jgi:hypothetical protein
MELLVPLELQEHRGLLDPKEPQELQAPKALLVLKAL